MCLYLRISYKRKREKDRNKWLEIENDDAAVVIMKRTYKLILKTN